MEEGKKSGSCEQKIILAAGIVLIAVAVLADMTPLGGAPGFGLKQITVLIFGLGILGYWFYKKNRTKKY